MIKNAKLDIRIKDLISAPILKINVALAKASVIREEKDFELKMRAEKAERLWAATVSSGLEKLSTMEDNKLFSDEDSYLLLGIRDLSKQKDMAVAWENARIVTNFFKQMSQTAFNDALMEVAELYTSLSKVAVPKIAPILSVLNGKITKQKQNEKSVESWQDTDDSETIISTDTGSSAASYNDAQLLSSWYVSAELDQKRMFSDGTIFYGPFSEKINANIFSMITNNSSGFDASVRLGSDIAGINGRNLSEATNKDVAGANNVYFVGEIASAFEAYRASKKNLKTENIIISPTGDVADILAEFAIRNVPFADKSDPKISEIKEWARDREHGISKFPEFYFAIKGLLSEKSNDVQKEREYKSISQNKKTNKIDTEENKEHINNMRGSPELELALNSDVVSSASIFEKDGDEKITNTLIVNAVDELQKLSSTMNNIILDQVMSNVTDSTSKFDIFFRKIIIKDMEIRKQLFNYLGDTGTVRTITPMWEFRNKFSLINMLLSRKEITNNLSGLMAKIIYAKSSLDGTLDASIRSVLLKKYILSGRDVSSLNEEISDATSEIKTLIIENITKVSENLIIKKLKTKSEDLSYSAASIDTIASEVIRATNIKSIATSYATEISMKKDMIAEENVIQVTKCGICDQVFSVPKEHKEMIDAYSRDVQNYSFYRDDNSLITEDELVGDLSAQKSYKLDDETSRYLVDKRFLISIGNRSSGSITRKQGRHDIEQKSKTIKTSYTWNEANDMIYSPKGIGDQIDGQIIRNFILKSCGATPSGGRGLFKNKTLCASSLYNMSASIVSSATKEYIDENDNFRCQAQNMDIFEPPVGAKPYQASSYVMPFGNLLKTKNAEKYKNSLGYMFSSNNAFCPCVIDKSFDLLRKVKNSGKKSYLNIVNNIAIPKLQGYSGLPEEILSDQSFFNEGFVSQPTTPNGDLLADIKTAYVICGRGVSLSMFDRDPSSKNFIQLFFKSTLEKGGQDSLAAAVKVMLNYGVDMNDIKPHVEYVLNNSITIKTSTRKKTIEELLKIARTVIAQDVSGTDISLLGALGLVCEHGHKFTLNQSWSFSKGNYGISLNDAGQVKTQALEYIISNPEAAMFNNFDGNNKYRYSIDNVSSFKIIDNELDEQELLSRGFKKIEDVKTIAELKQLIDDRQLIFKTKDGVAYFISGPASQTGGKNRDSKEIRLKNNPWPVLDLKRQARWSKKFIRYIKQESTTMPSESGGSGPGKSVEKDIASTLTGDMTFGDEEDSDTTKNIGKIDADEDSDKNAKDEEATEIEKSLNDEADDAYEEESLNSVYGVADHVLREMEMTFPDLEEDLKTSLKTDAQKTAIFNRREMNISSKAFQESLIKSLKLIRVWGVLAADSQIDFLRGGNPQIIINPNLKENIISVLNSIGSAVGLLAIDYQDEFFYRYNVDRLLGENIKVEHDKFFSMATIAQYYDGFSVPFFAHLNAKNAKILIVDSLKTALTNVLPTISAFATSGKQLDVKSEFVQKNVELLAQLLLSPYDNLFTSNDHGSFSDYKYITEKAISDYSGRAYIYSFAIDLADRIKVFCSQYLLNKSSTVYIGSGGPEWAAAETIINDLMSDVSVNQTSVRKILTISISEFSEKIAQLESYLKFAYSADNVFKEHMDNYSLSIKDRKTDQLGFAAQQAVVFSRLMKLLDTSVLSMNLIIGDLASKPINSPSIKQASKSLDGLIDSFIMERDPANYEKNKERMFKTAAIYGDKENIFEQNAVGYAKINLSEANQSLATVAYFESNMRMAELSRSAMKSDYFDLKTVSGKSARDLKMPNLFLLKKFVISNVRQLCLCYIPTSLSDPLLGSATEVKKYLAFDDVQIVDLDNAAGKDFIERYAEKLNVNVAATILIDPKFLNMNNRPTGIKGDEAFELLKNKFDNTIKIGKIFDLSLKTWPPPNNLIYNHFDVVKSSISTTGFVPETEGTKQREDTISIANSYYSSLNIPKEDHEKFVLNVLNFPDSKTSRTVNISSTHGILIPLRLGNEKAASKISSFLSNNVSYENTDVKTDGFTISDAGIFVKTSSGKRLDISWAFKMLDPQYFDENGKVRHKLVQAGSVQKLDLMLRAAESDYQWIIDNAEPVLTEVFGTTPSSFEQFIPIFLSKSSPCVRFSADIISHYQTAVFIPDTFEASIMLLGQKVDKAGLLIRLRRIIDYYNCAQILNSKYKLLKPEFDTVDSVDLISKERYDSLAIKLLDPFSLWKIVSNKFMSSDFGGPINKEDIDDYKAFIAVTFGLNDILGKICAKSGMSPNDITVEDLFDLPAFCNKYIAKKRRKDSAISALMAIFKLTEKDDDTREIKTYNNGYPIITESSKELAQIFESVESSSTKLDDNSYVEHICRLEDSLYGLVAKDRQDAEKVKAAKERNIALQKGEDTFTLSDLVSFSKKLSTRIKGYTKDSKTPELAKAGDFESLKSAALDIANHYYSGKRTKASNSLSWRKIAQVAYDDDGTILTQLYHELQQRYLDSMAKLTNQ